MEFTFGKQILCFLLETSVFNLFSSLQIPKKGKIYSVNEGNAKNWDGPTAKYASS